jgi:hypothetical protein
MTRSADVPFAAYPAYIKRHAPVIAACMLAGLLVGVAIGHRVATYVGSASVLAPPLDLGPHGVPDQSTTPLREKDAVTPDSEAEIATSTPVLSAVAKATGLPANYTALARRLTVDAPVNTQVLTVSFEARHPKAARLGAQAAATAFIAERARLIADRRTADMAALNAQIAALKAQLAPASTRTVTGGPAGQNVASIAQGAIINKIRSLQRVETRLTTAQTGAGTMLRPASESALHVRLGREVPAASGLLLGLLAGLALGRVRQHRFVSALDAQRAARSDEELDVLPVPATSRLASLAQPRRVGRARTEVGLRRVRNTIVAGGGGVTLLTGPARANVTAQLAGGLARSLVRLGEPVALVVDADDEATLHALHLSPAALLAITTTTAAGDDRAEADVDAYRLPTAPDDPAPAIAELRRAYPHVIVVAAGVPGAEACALARDVDRVLVTAERRRTPVAELMSVVRSLRLVGAPVTASLLVGAPVR